MLFCYVDTSQEGFFQEQIGIKQMYCPIYKFCFSTGDLIWACGIIIFHYLNEKIASGVSSLKWFIFFSY